MELKNLLIVPIFGNFEGKANYYEQEYFYITRKLL